MQIHIPYTKIDLRGEWNRNIMLSGKEKPAEMELKETYLDINNTATNTRTHIKAAQACTAKIIPNKVAIPLPPLNPAKTGNRCPITAIIPNAN